jgi:hypothetical protein
MKPPLTNTQEVLYTLIKQGYVNFYDFPTLIGLRTRLSEIRLKYGVKMEAIKATRNNKYGHPFTYHTHKLKDKEHAIKVYEKLTVNN